MLDILVPDVVLLGDGGRVKQTLPRPVVGADKVGRLPAAGLGGITEASLRPAQADAGPSLILRINGAIDTVVVLRIEDGLVTGLHAVRNPEKLSRMHRVTTLHR